MGSKNVPGLAKMWISAVVLWDPFRCRAFATTLVIPQGSLNQGTFTALKMYCAAVNFFCSKQVI